MKRLKDTGHPRSADPENASEWGSSQVLDEYEQPKKVLERRKGLLAALLRRLAAFLRGI